MRELQRLLKDITKLLSSLRKNGHIKGYCLIGGMGIGARGFPRATKDIDFLVDTEEDSFRKIFSQDLKKAGYLIKVFRGDIDDPLRSLIRIFNEKGNPLVDLILVYWDWQKDIISAAEPIHLEPKLVVPIAKAEDLIVLKLKAGSTRDLLDAEELIKVTDLAKRLDKDRLYLLSKRANVDKKLKNLLKRLGK